MSKGDPKGNPIPTKFEAPEENLLHDLKRKTGLSISEIIRRAVRALGMEIKERRESWLSFVVEDLGEDWPGHSARTFELPSREYGAPSQKGDSAPPPAVTYPLTLAKKKKRQAATKKKSAA